MKIRCIIIDDEPLAIKVIEKFLSEFSSFELVDTFNDPISALQSIDSGSVDVIFLDINMPRMNGLAFLRSLQKKPHIIITTAYREYAIESFDLNVLDYLIKPIPFERFLKSINKISNLVNLERNKSFDKSFKNEPSIFLKVDKKLMKINLNDILYIESLKDYINVFTTTGNYIVHKTMSSISDELPKDNFLRIHRSYNIAINKIKSIEGNSVEIANKRIPIGRNYLQFAKQKILNNDDFKE